jgi:hypothetical protein
LTYYSSQLAMRITDIEKANVVLEQQMDQARMKLAEFASLSDLLNSHVQTMRLLQELRAAASQGPQIKD